MGEIIRLALLLFFGNSVRALPHARCKAVSKLNIESCTWNLDQCARHTRVFFHVLAFSVCLSRAHTSIFLPVYCSGHPSVRPQTCDCACAFARLFFTVGAVFAACPQNQIFTPDMPGNHRIHTCCPAHPISPERNLGCWIDSDWFCVVERLLCCYVSLSRAAFVHRTYSQLHAWGGGGSVLRIQVSFPYLSFPTSSNYHLHLWTLTD